MKLELESVHRRITELLQQRRKFVVATIIEVKGSCPQRPGARMIIHPDGSFESTIGGGAFEAEVLQDAQAAFTATSPAIREYRLTKDDLGMYCQGLVKVLVEPYTPAPQLLILGGGHVGQALSRLAAATGIFRVVVVDDRAEFSDSKKHPDAHQVIHTDRSYSSGMPVLDDETYVVIVTRCHATDKLLVKQMYQAPVAYLGLIGSKAKARQFKIELQDEGMPLSYLETIHTPIGLQIGGKDPAEVAVSILAEVIQVKNSRASRNIQFLQIKDRNL